MLILRNPRVRSRPLIGLCLMVGTLTVGPPVHAVPTTSVSFAATFDTSTSGWLHTSTTSGDAVPRTTRSGGSEIIPADVLAVPGVVGSDKYVGVFPAFSVSGPSSRRTP